MIIDGKKIAERIIAELKRLPKPKKFLAAVLVGDDPISISFLKQKEKIAGELGIGFKLHKFPAEIGEVELRDKISAISADVSCSGLILQLPLPAHIKKENVISVILPEKDVDALHGNLVLPPVVGVILEILGMVNKELGIMKVAVVGLGFLVGKPISEWLKGKCEELILLDIGDNLGVLKNADLVISGAGKAGLVKPEMLKEDALVIDFGYSIEDEKIRGDFEPPADDTVIMYTPTPGGTGPILVAKLFENFYTLTGIQETF